MAEPQKYKVGIITQARMTSTRLPGKVLLTAGGKSMLQYHIDRLQQTGYEVTIATTINKEDDAIVNFALQQNIFYSRGSEHDVLARFMQVQREKKFDIIVRVTSDCPFIDPQLIQQGVNALIHSKSKRTYVSNCFPRTFARGFDFEVFSDELLEEAFLKGQDAEDREHVTPYLWKNKPGDITLQNISQTEQNGSLRITIDTSEDFELIQLLIEKYHADHLSHREIETILNDHPELVAINSHVEQKKN